MSKAQLPAPEWKNDKIIAAAGRLAREFEKRVGRDYIEMNGQRFEDVYAHLLYPSLALV